MYYGRESSFLPRTDPNSSKKGGCDSVRTGNLDWVVFFTVDTENSNFLGDVFIERGQRRRKSCFMYQQVSIF